MEIKRLGILIFYDERGFVSEYVKHLIRELKTVTTKLVVIVNGIIDECGIQELNKLSVRVIIRENIGYEMKAYEEFFFHYWDEYKNEGYDEIIMCNDSFYGPFIPMKELVDSFEEDTCDLWGINLADNYIVQVLHSYFRVFRKKIIADGALEKYFEENKHLCINCEADAVAIFEYGLFAELMDKGYTYSYYSYSQNKDMYSQPYTLIVNNKFPIMKRKAFSKKMCDAKEINKAIQYIDKETNYDINLILTDANKKYGCAWLEINRNTVNVEIRSKRNEIIQFLKKNPNVYIYGAGLKGRKFWGVYKKYMQNFQGFIVSDNQDMEQRELYGYPIFGYSEIDLSDSAIVVCVNEKHILEIEENLKNLLVFIV